MVNDVGEEHEVPLDVESRLQLQVNMGFVMREMHICFRDAGRIVRVLYSEL